ncbi:unnamed protein product [Triticum turgidum subsp. durum]|uniref:ATP synthase mitochondrial F1 complex assembly factor 1 n=1 Tax=Triticum turgidum subsp. durum TaxID=4567 RepID=A0A9R0Y5L5_TRITD|nr:unnamed protein product [Triticum turgidum subsp. durum]
MRRLPLWILRSAAAGSLRSPAPSRGGCPVPRAPHLPAEAAAAPAELARWLPRRGYSRFASGFTPLEPKKLGSILDVERAKGLSPEHLVAAWDDVSALPLLPYILFSSVLALRRSHSLAAVYKRTNFIFCTVQLPHMIFTGLEDYKARGTQASPYYTVTHFTEFAETKDTVLVRGDVVFTSKLTDAEAKCLLETAHSFYLNDVRYKLVERFNKETHDFEFKDVLQALEMPSM